MLTNIQSHECIEEGSKIVKNESQYIVSIIGGGCRLRGVYRYWDIFYWKNVLVRFLFIRNMYVRGG